MNIRPEFSVNFANFLRAHGADGTLWTWVGDRDAATVWRECTDLSHMRWLAHWVDGHSRSLMAAFAPRLAEIGRQYIERLGCAVPGPIDNELSARAAIPVVRAFIKALPKPWGRRRDPVRDCCDRFLGILEAVAMNAIGAGHLAVVATREDFAAEERKAADALRAMITPAEFAARAMAMPLPDLDDDGYGSEDSRHGNLWGHGHGGD